MDWVLLFVAGLLETGWAIGLKSSNGFTKLGPSVATVGLMAASFFLLARALQTIPIGTGYAVWTGIGAVGTVLVGMIFLGEPRDVGRIFCLFLIVAGIGGLKFFSSN